MKKLLTLLVFFVIGQIIFGQDDLKSGIIYGDNHAFMLTAPDGWVLDNKSGIKQGLYAVFYKQGESWEKAMTVMYTNTASLEDSSQNTIDKLITYDTNNFRRQYPDLNISVGKDIFIKPGLIAKVNYLSGISYGNYEAIAYIDAWKTGVMIVLSSRDKNGFQDSLVAFENLVKSYLFMADKVIIDSKNK
jgi:hypothetical protein